MSAANGAGAARGHLSRSDDDRRLHRVPRVLVRCRRAVPADARRHAAAGASGRSQPRHSRASASARGCRARAATLALGLTYDLIRDDKYRYFRCPVTARRVHAVLRVPAQPEPGARSDAAGSGCAEAEAASRSTCSSCGAPIDLQTQTKCESCGSGLAIVDLDHLGDALRQLDADARAAATVHRRAAADAAWTRSSPTGARIRRPAGGWRQGDEDDRRRDPDRSARRRRDAAVASAGPVATIVTPTARASHAPGDRRADADHVDASCGQLIEPGHRGGVCR